jgi:3-methyl-2-oxobutanoate hydroxymethyltransferase
MSITQLRDPLAQKVTPQTLLGKKQAGVPITALTAYDYATARLVDDAGIDMLLVGDSLAQVVLGYENTLPVTMEEMLHHTRGASCGAPGNACCGYAVRLLST